LATPIGIIHRMRDRLLLVAHIIVDGVMSSRLQIFVLVVIGIRYSLTGRCFGSWSVSTTDLQLLLSYLELHELLADIDKSRNRQMWRSVWKFWLCSLGEARLELLRCSTKHFFSLCSTTPVNCSLGFRLLFTTLPKLHRSYHSCSVRTIRTLTIREKFRNFLQLNL